MDELTYLDDRAILEIIKIKGTRQRLVDLLVGLHYHDANITNHFNKLTDTRIKIEILQEKMGDMKPSEFYAHIRDFNSQLSAYEDEIRGTEKLMRYRYFRNGKHLK